MQEVLMKLNKVFEVINPYLIEYVRRERLRGCLVGWINKLGKGGGGGVEKAERMDGG